MMMLKASWKVKSTSEEGGSPRDSLLATIARGSAARDGSAWVAAELLWGFGLVEEAFVEAVGVEEGRSGTVETLFQSVKAKA
ncbi:hypothetical protein CCP2SC5_460023 [Azospirillaceae bacterium]